VKYRHYIDESDQYMHSLYMCMDNAWAAEKMYDWGNLGDDNPAWKDGPYISAGANSPQIDRSHPYCLRLSSSSSSLAGYQIGPNAEIGEHGGVPAGHERDRIRASAIIPTVAIGMQFSLLEALDIDLFLGWAGINGVDLSAKPAKRYDRRPARSRMETINELSSCPISEKAINAYESVSNFRNKLTHEPAFFCGVPDCAIDVYIVCQAVASSIYGALFGVPEYHKIVHRRAIWSKRLEGFHDVIEFS